MAEDDLSRGVAAVITVLRMPLLDEISAAEMAEAEGIVSHLTSLIIADEAGETQTGLPGQRKVRLPKPATSMRHMPASVELSGVPSRVSADVLDDMARMPMRDALESLGSASRNYRAPLGRALPGGLSLEELKRAIDWRRDPNRLLAGDISLLPSGVQRIVAMFARHAAIASAARQLGVSPTALVLALIVDSAGQDGDHAAARVGRSVLKSLTEEEIRDLWGVLEE